MTPTQCKMARAALGWSVRELADKSGVHFTSVSQFERGRDAYQSTIVKLEKAILNTGKVRFDGDCVCIQ